MDRLFEWVPVEIIVDDFLIHGEDQRDIDQKLRAVLNRSREVGLKFNLNKVKLRVPEVSYVGHILSSEGLKPDPEKVRAIDEMPPPTDKEGVLRILGTINYLDKFIEHNADLQGPMSQLTLVLFVMPFATNSRESRCIHMTSQDYHGKLLGLICLNMQLTPTYWSPTSIQSTLK